MPAAADMLALFSDIGPEHIANGFAASLGNVLEGVSNQQEAEAAILEISYAKSVYGFDVWNAPFALFESQEAYPDGGIGLGDIDIGFIGTPSIDIDIF